MSDLLADAANSHWAILSWNNGTKIIQATSISALCCSCSRVTWHACHQKKIFHLVSFTSVSVSLYSGFVTRSFVEEGEDVPSFCTLARIPNMKHNEPTNDNSNVCSFVFAQLAKLEHVTGWSPSNYHEVIQYTVLSILQLLVVIERWLYGCSRHASRGIWCQHFDQCSDGS